MPMLGIMGEPRFFVESMEEAVKKGWLQEWEYYKPNDEYCSGIFEKLPDGTIRMIGRDGGAPEDQTLGRDWDWVVAALNEAYQAGWNDAANHAAKVL